MTGFRSFSKSYRILLLFTFFLIHSFILILQRTRSRSLLITAQWYVILLIFIILDLNICGVSRSVSRSDYGFLYKVCAM